MSQPYAYEIIRRRALELVDENRVDPEEQREEARQMVKRAVEEYQDRAWRGEGKSLADPNLMQDRVVRSIIDYGPLTGLLARSDIEEIFLEGSRVTYLESGGRLRSVEEPTSLTENRHVIDRLLSGTDRRLDSSNPMVQARVLNGSARLTAVIPPISDQVSVTLRRYALRQQTLASLVRLGSLTDPAASFLSLVAQTRGSFVLSGPPGAGKTSMLSAILGAVPPNHCIRCCEEVRELNIPLVHGSFYEARPPSIDGKGEISLRDLVKVVLAMRPDRIVVGEVRGAEAFELTRAVNAGCGFACTVHANSARDALEALVNAALMAGENVAEGIVRRVFGSAIDLVVHCDRNIIPTPEGWTVQHEVFEILALVPGIADGFSTQPLFSRSEPGAPLTWSGALPPSPFAEQIERVMGPNQKLVDVLEGKVGRLT